MRRKGSDRGKISLCVLYCFDLWIVHVNVTIKNYLLKKHCLSKKNRAMNISFVYTPSIYFYSDKITVIYAEINVTIYECTKKRAWYSGKSIILEPEGSGFKL